MILDSTRTVVTETAWKRRRADLGAVVATPSSRHVSTNPPRREYRLTTGLQCAILVLIRHDILRSGRIVRLLVPNPENGIGDELTVIRPERWKISRRNARDASGHFENCHIWRGGGREQQ